MSSIFSAECQTRLYSCSSTSAPAKTWSNAGIASMTEQLNGATGIFNESMRYPAVYSNSCYWLSIPMPIRSPCQSSRPLSDTFANPQRYSEQWKQRRQKCKHAALLAFLEPVCRPSQERQVACASGHREHPLGGKELSTIILTSWWKEDVRHLWSLEGYAYNVDALFDALSLVWIVLDCYVRFLYHISVRSSVPCRQCSLVSRTCSGADVPPISSGAHLICARRACWERFFRAFRMRDDFVTPAVLSPQPYPKELAKDTPWALSKIRRKVFIPSCSINGVLFTMFCRHNVDHHS